MDVGGGSTEYTVFRNEEKVKSKSFNIGTIRLRDNLVKEGVREEMNVWLKDIAKKYKPELIIGSGGNINKLFKISGLPHMTIFKKAKLQQLKEHLESFSLEDRIEKMGLRPDRADVIIPAAELFLNTMRQAKIGGVLVPKVGLADGIIHQLYHEYKAKNG